MIGKFSISTEEAVKLIVDGLKRAGISLPKIKPENVIFVFDNSITEFEPIVSRVELIFDTKETER